MRIVDNVRPDRQTVMFSATFPRAMEALARRILAKPIEVQVGGRSVVCSDVEQHVVNLRFISISLIMLYLLAIFGFSRIILFMITQSMSDPHLSPYPPLLFLQLFL